MASSRVTIRNASEAKVCRDQVLKKQNRVSELAELKKGIRLRESEIKIYEELIAEQQQKLKDASLPRSRKFKIEWDVNLLKDDIERWKVTIRSCTNRISELEGTGPSTAVKFQI